MVSIVAQLVAMAHAGRVPRMPRLETIESIMRLSQMVVQALWDTKSPMLQLPHVSDDILRHFITRKRNIRTIRDLAKMKEEDRRPMLRNLSDQDYYDLLLVLMQMPLIEMNAKCQGGIL
jgi:translocation protein SEC63